ncbi:hypothetical protein BWQ93_03260 [Sphingopyxis sp. QXT-31]|uniref:hypothetical protein n=1 Tax=Sphingopyxis sp. QXT-31 TaxID=1357916 RepID=UPI0009792841|nr:hypothetical protein [Sphingopyxis sp. QXT-31]APZ97612.1 hypothetical protein BWQ93_03260 [Sphingopyxis sp. QXT-31]
MAEGDAVDELLQRAAARHGLPLAILQDLLALEGDFPDFTVHGAKSEFTRRVTALLDAAAGEGGDP